MIKTYICDYFANNKEGESVREYTEILYASNLNELSQSILNMAHHYMEDYEAVNIYVNVYEWANGQANKFFNGRVYSNFPANIII